MQYALFTSCLIGFFLVLHLLKKKGRHLTIMAILIGFGIKPVVGPWIATGMNAATGMAFGLAVPVVLGVFVTAWLFYDIKEKRNDKKTPWIGFAAASIIGAAAINGLPVLDNITKTGNSIMQTGNSSVSGGGGGGTVKIKVKKAKTSRTPAGVRTGKAVPIGK